MGTTAPTTTTTTAPTTTTTAPTTATTTAPTPTETCSSFAEWPNTLKSCGDLKPCVHLVKTKEYATCSDYCASLPGHTCFYAAEESSNECWIKHELSCDTDIKQAYSTSDMLCGCSIARQTTTTTTSTTTPTTTTTTTTTTATTTTTTTTTTYLRTTAA